MTPTPNALRLVRSHLAQISATPAGHRALERFAVAGVDLAGAADLDALVRQCRPPEGRRRRAEVLRHVVPLTPEETIAAHTTLVTLGPELARMARLLARGPLDHEEAGSEMVTIGLEVLSRSRDWGQGCVPERVVNAIWTQTRRTWRLRRRGQIDVVLLERDYDAPAPEVDPLERWPGLLAAAVARGVLTPRQLVIIAGSRMEGRPLREIAASLGRPYGAVNQERWRAEVALRAFIATYARGDVP